MGEYQLAKRAAGPASCLSRRAALHRARKKVKLKKALHRARKNGHLAAGKVLLGKGPRRESPGPCHGRTEARNERAERGLQVGHMGGGDTVV